MKKYLNWAVVILGIITVMSFGQQNPEQDFVNKAVMANQYEVALAQQAGQRSSNESIKAYSRMLVDEHQQILNELRQYAEAKGWTISTDLDQTHQGQLEVLEGTEVDRYNQAFKDAAVASHENSIALYEAVNGNNAMTDETLKIWVADKLPTLKSHLSQAQQLKLDDTAPINNQVPPTIDTVRNNKM
ncbi:DUF4142 domain-containing protein [Sphingobacterium yanglingense]|uniref:Putative membrane protein n=1 Tax=Sphingobacterium yanglingense TaxID=1437280 RepID=A0A4R6WIB4_9SPHI|nr:DUF4142 domain-containing protein [Sphingobacterium yanglingense]TDQ80010.1 putative membrane protein [Sphingobacterium yanglingense]